MWSWIIGFVVIVGIIVFVLNRRGSTGASKADDLPSRYSADGQKHDGGFLPGGTGHTSGGGGAGL
jgi:hypothetical protein